MQFIQLEDFSFPTFSIFLFKIKVSMGKSRNYGLQECNISVPRKKMIPAISVSTHAYASASHDFSHDPPRLRRRPFFYGTFSIDSTGTLYSSVILSVQPAFYVLIQLLHHLSLFLSLSHEIFSKLWYFYGGFSTQERFLTETKNRNSFFIEVLINQVII